MRMLIPGGADLKLIKSLDENYYDYDYEEVNLKQLF